MADYDATKTYAVSGEELHGIAEAIRLKRDITDGIPVADMAMQVGLIDGGGGNPYPRCYAFGSVSCPADITDKSKTLYFSLPNFSLTQFNGSEIEPILSTRPVYLLIGSIINGSANSTTVLGYSYQYSSIPSNVDSAPNNYSVGILFEGVSNGQKVYRIIIPSQTVNRPSSGYDFNFAVYKPKANSNPPELIESAINLGNIQLDTWVDVGDIGKVYFGWTNPVV